MSTELKGRLKNTSLTRFSGGHRGTCVQITKPAEGSSPTAFEFISVPRSEALALAMDLLEFANGTEQSAEG